MLLTGLYSLFGLIALVLFALSLFSFIDAAIRPTQAFPAAGKQTKPFWLIILGVATAWYMLLGIQGALGILGIAAAIAVIVYLVDVRPALRALGSGGPRSGPYGPW